MSADVETKASSQTPTAETLQTVAISGPNGLVGKALSARLQTEGKDVVGISRSEGSWENTIRWDPDSGLTNPARLETVDAVVHLAGENVAGGRWSSRMKGRIRHSRVAGTRNLVQSMAAIEKRPKVLVCASAIGLYGSRGDEELLESSAPGDDFLAEVCRDWEAEANAATELGIRVVNIRIGVVLSPNGGALKKMLLPFKLGLGGVIGSGKQFMSWIGLNDLTRIISFCLHNDIHGPVNAVSPEPLTNRDFTKCMGRVLRRPTIFPLPAPVLRLGLGEMAEALFLSSTRVLPGNLQKAGFQFEQPDLESCLRHELQISS